MSIAFYFEINLLNKTKTTGACLSIFVYLGLFFFGALSYIFNGSEFEFDEEIISIALFIGVLSYLSTSWKVDVVKKIPVESSGIIFGMISVFHVAIESVLRGYIMYNAVISVILMCISISMVFKVNIRTAIFEAVMYCIAISLLRNFEFATVTHFNADPFLWMGVLSIPSFVLYFHYKSNSTNSDNFIMDSHSRKIVILWLILPPAYHYIIIMVSPTIASLTVATGYILASAVKMENKKVAVFSSLLSMTSVVIAST